MLGIVLAGLWLLCLGALGCVLGRVPMNMMQGSSLEARVKMARMNCGPGEGRGGGGGEVGGRAGWWVASVGDSRLVLVGGTRSLARALPSHLSPTPPPVQTHDPPTHSSWRRRLG